MHCNFGIDLTNTIKMENPQLGAAEVKEEIKGGVPEGCRP